MGKKEEPMIAYYEDARHFAWLVNGWICGGDARIDASQIRPRNIRLTGKTGKGRQIRTRSRFRDISKEIGNMKVFLLIGTELQTFVDYSMPVRVMDYDALEYKDQIKNIQSKKKTEAVALQRKQQVELSSLQKEDRLVPVITLVLYMGEEPWDAAQSLQDLLDLSEVPEEFRGYISDYKTHVLDVCHTPDERLLEFPKDIASMFLTIKYQKDLEALKKALRSIPELERVEEDTYDAVWGFLDKRMLELKEKTQDGKGEVNMCKAVDQMLECGRKEGIEIGLERGMERGIAQEKIVGIKNMIELCQEWGGTYDNTQFQVEKRYHLNEAEAKAYMEQYWK